MKVTDAHAKTLFVKRIELAYIFSVFPEMATHDKNGEAYKFYCESLDLLTESGIPFMLGGAFAIFYHTGIYRDTKDLDIFVKSSDYPKLLKYFVGKGFKVQVHDARWIAKVWRGECFIDIIFSSVQNICHVDQSWFDRAPTVEMFDRQVKVVAAEEVIFCKSYVWNRERFDGADINHLLLKCGKKLDWKHLLDRLDVHWHLLLAELLLFQFTYPSDYLGIIPQWIFDELLGRAKEQYDLPPAVVNVCRGPLIDNTSYCIDVKDWGYKSCTIRTI
jgi:hypothetical protein